MSKYEDIKQIFEERVKKETFTMLCYEENSKSSMIISSKENFNYDDVCKDLKTSDTLFIFEKNIDFCVKITPPHCHWGPACGRLARG